MSYCDVDFGDESADADPVEFLDITTPRARKEHKCCECRGAISVRATYYRVSYKFEGKFGTDRVCEACWEAMQEFDYHIFGGDFWRSMREQWDNGANVQGCINRLSSAAAKEHMRRQWAKWKQLELPPAQDAVDPHGPVPKADD